MNSMASDASKLGSRLAQPIVECVLGPAHGGGRHIAQPLGRTQGHLHDLVVIGHQRDEADAFSFLAGGASHNNR